MHIGLSIITPHKDDINGIFEIYNSLKNQTSTDWQWIIIDDLSSEISRTKLIEFQSQINADNIKIIYNQVNLKAGPSRNEGLQYASFENIVFLDSDDFITEKFVQNRLIRINDFTAFLNIKTKSTNGEIGNYSTIKENFLDNYLKAKFAWQTSSVVWDKNFLLSIGGFNPNLELLEDVELIIKGLLSSNKFETIDNQEIDFYYFSQPLTIQKRNFSKVEKSVTAFLDAILSKHEVSGKQIKYLSGYYFLAVKYICRFSEFDKLDLLSANCKLFYNHKIFNFFQFFIANLLIILKKKQLVSTNLFLKINRYLYKQ